MTWETKRSIKGNLSYFSCFWDKIFDPHRLKKVRFTVAQSLEVCPQSAGSKEEWQGRQAFWRRNSPS